MADVQVEATPAVDVAVPVEKPVERKPQIPEERVGYLQDTRKYAVSRIAEAMKLADMMENATEEDCRDLILKAQDAMEEARTVFQTYLRLFKTV